MKEHIIENKELNNEIYIVDDFYIFKNPNTKFTLNCTINVDLTKINKKNNINVILCASSNRSVSGSEVISNGYDICIMKSKTVVNKYILAIRYMSGRIINIFDIPSNIQNIKLNIFISHKNNISNININNISNSIKIFNYDNTVIKLGGKENIYGEPYNMIPIDVKKFKLWLN